MQWNSVWKIAAPAVLAVAVLVSGAQAADLGGRPSLKDDPDGAPRYLWTGAYAGLQAGYGWGASRQTNTVSLVTTGSYDIDGYVAGGTLGYNMQSGSTVWGIESDLSFSDVSGRTFNACGAGCTSTVDWLMTVRARLGLDMNGWMPYITAGLALGDTQSRIGGAGSRTELSVGWTVGGGVEVKLDRNWSVKAEYLYVDLGDMSYTLVGNNLRADFDEIHIVRGGINYKF